VKIAEELTKLVGNTPLVRIGRYRPTDLFAPFLKNDETTGGKAN